MKTTHTRIACTALVGVLGLSLAIAQTSSTGDNDAQPSPPTWEPPEIERGAYDDITAYNIFVPDRAALAAEAQREPEPDEPDDPTPIEPVVELPPPDPDAALVLVGVSIRGEVATAHIEDRTTGTVIVLNELGPFSEGAIQGITIYGLTYRVRDETRSIKIGQALTGETPEPGSPSADTGTTNSISDTPTTPGEAGSESAPPGDGLSDLERRMRERRNSE